MPRRPRRAQWTDAACYHVMNRGQNRATIFNDDQDRAYFLKLVARYQQRYAVRLYHYCLMDNHFHLLVQLAQPRQLSRLIASLLVAYVRYVQLRYRLVGHVFQGRFKSPAIEAEPYLLSCGRYIERNPVAANLVAHAWEYRWSSCRAYALGESDALLAVNPWYEQLAVEPARRQVLWRDFLEGEDPKEEVLAADDWAIGEPGFRRTLYQPQSRAVPRVNGRPAA